MHTAAMNIRQFRYFLILAETLNFRRAADRLHISQQAVSKSIMQLEEQCGVRLFERGRQSVTLTRAGSRLMPYATEVIAAAHRFEEAIGSLSDTRSGKIAIGATPTFLESLLPEVLTDFQQRYPRVSVKVERGDFSSLTNAMIGGELDVVLSTAPQTLPRHLVTCKVIGQDRNVILVRRGHPLTGSNRPISCQDLASYPAMVTVNYTRGSDFVLQLFEAEGQLPPAPALSIGSTLLAYDRLESTDCWWVAPRLQVERKLQSGAFVALDVGIEDEIWDLVLATRRHSEPLHWVAGFQEIVCDRLKQHLR